MQKVSLKGQVQDLEELGRMTQGQTAGTLGYKGDGSRWRKRENITGCYALERPGAGLWSVAVWGSLQY